MQKFESTTDIHLTQFKTEGHLQKTVRVNADTSELIQKKNRLKLLTPIVTQCGCTNAKSANSRVCQS